MNGEWRVANSSFYGPCLCLHRRSAWGFKVLSWAFMFLFYNVLCASEMGRWAVFSEPPVFWKDLSAPWFRERTVADSRVHRVVSRDHHRSSRNLQRFSRVSGQSQVLSSAVFAKPSGVLARPSQGQGKLFGQRVGHVQRTHSKVGCQLVTPDRGAPNGRIEYVNGRKYAVNGTESTVNGTRKWPSGRGRNGPGRAISGR